VTQADTDAEVATPATPDGPAAGASGPATRRTGPVNGGPALLLMALGLVLVAQAAVDAREAAGGPSTLDQALYVGGLLLVLVPAALGALLPRIAASTRVLLVLAMMVLLQLARLVVEPTRFVQPEELISLDGLRIVQETDRLGSATGLAPLDAAHPGLQVVTDAVCDLTGLGDHLSGVAVLVAARVVLALAVLVVVAALTGSTRAGATGVVVYALSPHLAVLGASYDGETLAVPLAVLVVHLVLTRRRGSWPGALLGLAPAALALAAVVATDQPTAVALVVALAVWAVLEAVLRQGSAGTAAALLGLVGVGVVSLGLALAVPGSSLTRPDDVDGGRVLFGSLVEGVASDAVLVAVVVALALLVVAVVLALLLPTRQASPAVGTVPPSPGLDSLGAGAPPGSTTGPTPVVEPGERSEPEPFETARPSPPQEPSRPGEPGTRSPVVEPGERSEPESRPGEPGTRSTTGALGVLLGGVAALVVVVPLGLLSPSAAAVADRATALVFVGVAYVLARHLWSGPLARTRSERTVRVLAVGAAVVFVGAGVLGAGEVADQLPGPYRPADGARSVDDDNLAAARWIADTLPPGSTVYADRVSGLLAAGVGGQDVVRRSVSGVDASSLLLDPDVGPTDVRAVREAGIDYLVVDRRDAEALPRQGFYAEPGEPGGDDRTEPVPAEALRKFSSVPGVDVVYDNGSIVVYDLGGLDVD